MLSDVVLLELLTGKIAMDKGRPQGQHNLVQWVSLATQTLRKWSWKSPDLEVRTGGCKSCSVGSQAQPLLSC